VEKYLQLFLSITNYSHCKSTYSTQKENYLQIKNGSYFTLSDAASYTLPSPLKKSFVLSGSHFLYLKKIHE
jgi:hypothetical protein